MKEEGRMVEMTWMAIMPTEGTRRSACFVASVRKVGGVMVVTIPKDIMDKMHLEEGSDLDVRVSLPEVVRNG